MKDQIPPNDRDFYVHSSECLHLIKLKVQNMSDTSWALFWSAFGPLKKNLNRIISLEKALAFYDDSTYYAYKCDVSVSKLYSN